MPRLVSSTTICRKLIPAWRSSAITGPTHWANSSEARMRAAMPSSGSLPEGGTLDSLQPPLVSPCAKRISPLRARNDFITLGGDRSEGGFQLRRLPASWDDWVARWSFRAPAGTAFWIAGIAFQEAAAIPRYRRFWPPVEPARIAREGQLYRPRVWR